jgi:glycogen(starch) synthase
MRVLMTTDSIGGVWTYSLELANGLAEHGVETTLAVMGKALRADQWEELEQSHVADVYTTPLALEWMPDPWSDLEQAASWLLEIRDRVMPDLVHLNSYAHASLCWQAPVVVVGHSCVLSWFEAVRREPAGAEWQRYRGLVAESIATADLVVAPTRWMLRALERHYGVPGSAVVIPNSRRVRAASLVKQPLIASVGRLWDEAKNVAALVRVAPQLSWPVLLAGDGAPDSGANVVPLGELPRSQVDLLLARSSVFALPARYEPFGLGPLEAALAGSALVLGDVPSLREVWGETALFVDPEDDEALCEALRLLIQQPDMRTELALQARGRAQAYTPERMAKAYVDAYGRLLAREPAQAV